MSGEQLYLNCFIGSDRYICYRDKTSFDTFEFKGQSLIGIDNLLG